MNGFRDIQIIYIFDNYSHETSYSKHQFKLRKMESRYNMFRLEWRTMQFFYAPL